MPYIFDDYNKIGHHSWTYRFNGSSDTGYRMAIEKVLSVDATVCIVVRLTHKFGLCVKLMVTSTSQWLYIQQ